MQAVRAVADISDGWQAAQSALTETFGSEDTQTYEAPTFRGKKFRHWSQWFCTAAAIVGTIVTVAAAALNMIPVAVVAGVLALTGAISTFYLRRFVPQLANEQMALLMAQRIRGLGQLVQRISEVRDRYQATVDQLGQEVEQAGRTSQELQTALNDRTVEVRQLHESIQGLRDEIADYKGVYDAVEELAKTAAEKTMQANAARQRLIDVQQQAEAPLEEFQRGLQQAGDLTARTDVLRATLNEQLQQSEKLNTVLETKIAEFKRTAEEAREAQELLQATIEDFQQRMTDAEEAKQQEVAELQRQLNEARAAAEDLDPANVAAVGDIGNSLPDL